TVFLREPFKVEPLVTFVRHDYSAERRVAADERGKEPVHASGLAGTGVAGEKEMPVGLVASPSETGKREHDLPPIRDDLSGEVAHISAMIRVVEEQASER